MSTVQTLHIRIEGHVQGVGYRAWAEYNARAMGLRGWVRNRRDRSVEMVLHGPSDDVADMVRCCERGPPGARVTRVEILGEVAGTFDGFKVLPTA
jgi:acylphosphatase